MKPCDCCKHNAKDAFNWYIEQRSRWNALEHAGWHFSRPANTNGGIGLSMERMNVKVTITCDRNDTFRNIHTRLITLCEAVHSASASDESRAPCSCSQGECIHTKPSWDDDPVLGPLIREAYSEPANMGICLNTPKPNQKI